MTLFRQLMLLIVILFILCFVGTMYVTFIHTKSYYAEQLEITAQDTATSLGLSISSHIEDKSTMLSQVSAIFDRGYFTKITVKSNKDQVLVSKEQKPNYENLPAWFVHLVSFKSPKRSALIMSGWKQVGTIDVTSNPTLAYFELWKTSTTILKWFFSMVFIALAFAYAATKALFKPLLRVAEQAQEICRNVFHVETHVPKTKELRIVTEAMNKTVIKLKQIFKEQASQLSNMREKSFRDSLTKMGNRSFFESKLRTLLVDESTFEAGHLVFLEISGLKTFNQTHGFEAGDALVTAVAKVIRDNCAERPTYCIARTTGSNFAMILLAQSNQEIEQFAQHVLSEVKQYCQGSNGNIHASIGACDYSYKQDRGALLSLADSALLNAKQQGEFSSHITLDTDSLGIKDLSDWKTLLQEAISNGQVLLNHQRVLNVLEQTYHHEVLIRLKREDGEILSPGQFIPMAEKCGMGFDLDLYVLDKIAEISKDGETYTINLSASTVLSRVNAKAFLKRLITKYKGCPLQFEISESLVEKDEDQVRKFIDRLHDFSYKVGLDRVGGRFSTLLYLSLLKINYIKMDGSYTQDIESNESKQTMVRLLKNATDSLDITLVGTNVESDSEWQTLQEIGVQWGQGKFLSSVKNITN